MRCKRLPRSFYARDTHVVALDLLGKILIHRTTNKEYAVRIVEVESYVGQNDKACHASRGRTPRTEVMFGPAGYSYVYMIYGMYHCLNIVTETKGFPAAVLIRAGEPLTETLLTNGPGKLCRALHITRAHNNHDMSTSTTLFVGDDGYSYSYDEIIHTTRVGVAYAGNDALLPWRYYVQSSPFVSKK